MEKDIIEIIKKPDFLSNLSSLDVILKVNGKYVRVVRNSFEDKEQKTNGYFYNLICNQKVLKREEKNIKKYCDHEVKW